jgi:hypothetical protein
MEIRTPRIELCEELLLQVCEEAKGYALAEVALCDDEEGEAAGGRLVAWEVGGRLDEAVDEVFGLVDGFVRGFRVGDSGEDERDEGGGVGRGGGGVFGEDGGVVGYACTAITLALPSIFDCIVKI